ncbi:hypothetical protein [Streptomyces sp. JJ38]|uniref:hypothetical protein n=1 Tax=Streptomyces sp. JJ38 TaxID=2738128 RepID=UPI001C563B45|nr:hypothetical protein [Streptomyces sp. JJ38]MBW1595701.1 hypothetical protein [Streptomyces sp. JJ38]
MRLGHLLRTGAIALSTASVLTFAGPPGQAPATAHDATAARNTLAAPEGPAPPSAAAGRVVVAQHARPHLNVRSGHGWPGGPPGRVVGTLRPGSPMRGYCHITDGAILRAWGRTSSEWVQIYWLPSRTGTAWVWAGGLNPYDKGLIPPC